MKWNRREGIFEQKKRREGIRIRRFGKLDWSYRREV